MNFSFLGTRCLAYAVFAFSVGLAACGGEPPEALLASAKGYLAKNELKSGIIELKNVLQKKDIPEARFLLGKALLDSETPLAAQIELRKARALGYPDEQVLPLLAKALLDSGNLDGVIELDNTTALNPPEAVATFKTIVAQAQVGQGHPEMAEIALRAALAANPAYSPALLFHARLLADRSELDAAFDIANEVLARAPDDAAALTLKADLLQFGRRDLPGALIEYRKALARSPLDLDANSGLLTLLLGKNDIDAARAQLNLLKKDRPKHTQTVYFEARFAAQTGDLDTASRLAQQLLKSSSDNPQFLQLAGVVALQRGELLVAEQHLRKLITTVPAAVAGRQALARVYMRNGEPEKALAVLTPLLESKLPDGETLALAGAANLVLGDTKTAEELFKRGAKIEPADSSSRISLALLRISRADTATAGLADLDAIAKSERGMVADLALISIYTNRRDYEAALKAIKQLETKQPAAPLPFQLRAKVLLLRGDLKGARENYEKALAADGKYFPAIDGLAALDVLEKRPEEARKRLEAVLKANPQEVRAITALASLDESEGKPKQLIVDRLVKAMSLKPNDPLLRTRLIQLYLRERDNKLALNAAQEAAAALPNDLDMLALLAATQVTAGAPDQAISSYSKLVALRPRSAAPLLGLASAQLASKSYDAAAETIERAEALAPDSVVLLQTAIQIDALSGKFDEALAKARRVQARFPSLPNGWLYEGDVEMSRKNWPPAIRAYRSAIQKEPAAPIARRLHTALRNSGNRTEADAFSNNWTRVHPQDAEFVFYLAGGAIEDRDYATAQRDLEQVLRLAPDNPAALNNLAWLLATQKKAGAVELAERANRIKPNHPDFIDTLALALEGEGRAATALEIVRNAVQQNPDASGLRLRLARLYLQTGDKASARSELDRLAALGDDFAQQAEVRTLSRGL